MFEISLICNKDFRIGYRKQKSFNISWIKSYLNNLPSRLAKIDCRRLDAHLFVLFSSSNFLYIRLSKQITSQYKTILRTKLDWKYFKCLVYYLLRAFAFIIIVLVRLPKLRRNSFTKISPKVGYLTQKCYIHVIIIRLL